MLLALRLCNGKGGQAGGDLHLHVDRAGLDPLKGYGGNPLDHAAPEGGQDGKNIRGTEEEMAWGQAAKA